MLDIMLTRSVISTTIRTSMLSRTSLLCRTLVSDSRDLDEKTNNLFRDICSGNRAALGNTLGLMII